MTATMKPSGIDWIGSIPSDWSLKKIRFATTIRTEVGKYKPDDVFIGLENVEGSTGRLVETESEYEEGTYDVFRKGDVLFSKLRPYLEKAFIADFDGFCTGEFVIFKGFEGDKKFLFYFLLSHGFIEIVNASTYGAKMPRASWDYIKNLNMPLPCASEQQAIAALLDDRCGQIDGIVADLERQVEILRQYKKALITETATKGLDKAAPMKDSGIDWIGEMPSHWETKRLKYVVNNHDAKRKPIEASERSQTGDTLYDYYGASGIVDKIDDYIFDFTALLIGEDGANLVLRNLRLIYIAAGKYWVNNHAHVLTPKQDSDLWYLAHQMEIIDYKDFITGSAQPKLSQEKLNNVVLVIPPHDEQKAIGEYLNAKCGEVDDLIAEKQKAAETMRQYKKSLIYEYVTGKKRVAG